MKSAIIKRDAPTVWLLVKVPQITAMGSGADQTAGRLRACIRDDHFGGEKAAVRRLTKEEVAAIQFVSDSRPRVAIPVDTKGDKSHE